MECSYKCGGSQFIIDKKSTKSWEDPAARRKRRLNIKKERERELIERAREFEKNRKEILRERCRQSLLEFKKKIVPVSSVGFDSPAMVDITDFLTEKIGYDCLVRVDEYVVQDKMKEIFNSVLDELRMRVPMVMPDGHVCKLVLQEYEGYRSVCISYYVFERSMIESVESVFYREFFSYFPMATPSSLLKDPHPRCKCSIVDRLVRGDEIKYAWKWNMGIIEPNKRVRPDVRSFGFGFPGWTSTESYRWES